MSKNIAIRSLTSEYEEKALELLYVAFFPDEVVCRCVRLLEDSPKVQHSSPNKKLVVTEGTKELEMLMRDCLKDNLSVIAVDETTNKVVGVAFNKLQEKNSSYFLDFKKKMKDPSALRLMDFMIDIDSRFDLFAHYKATSAIELTFLAVDPAVRGQRLGHKLIEATLRIAENHPKAEFVSAIYSAPFSQNAGALSGMETLLEFTYDEFYYKGQSFSDYIGPEFPTCTLAAKKTA